MPARRAAGVLLAALVVCGCGTSESTDEAGSEASAADAAPAPPATAPTELPPGEPVQTRCGDGVGDARLDDLSDVAIVGTDDLVVVEFTFDQPLRVSGGVVVAIVARSKDNTESRQFAVQLRQGRPPTAFVGDADSVQRLDGNVHRTRHAVHVGFPVEAFRPLGEGWEWRALAGSEDAARDFCPGAGTGAAEGAWVSVG